MKQAELPGIAFASEGTAFGAILHQTHNHGTGLEKFSRYGGSQG
jgi:hypothetical protein